MSLALAFCGDDDLGYARSRAAWSSGASLAMDESYRLAHLPLVAPDHPRIIARRDGAHYDNGRHPRVFSVVLPVPADALDASPTYRGLLVDLRGSPVAPKIAWDLLDRRRERLHATICGSLAIGETPPVFDAPARDALRALGPFQVELRGLFAGNVNVGRLYLPAYPERRAGANIIQAAQAALGGRITDLYVVGLLNLVDDLDAQETAALAGLLARWRETLILRFAVTELHVLGASDDLALDSAVVDTLQLTDR